MIEKKNLLMTYSLLFIRDMLAILILGNRKVRCKCIASKKKLLYVIYNYYLLTVLIK